VIIFFSVGLLNLTNYKKSKINKATKYKKP